MKMQVKLYADDGKRLWVNEYAVGLDVDTAIRVIDDELNSRLGSALSSSTYKNLMEIRNQQRTVQLKSGKTVTVERKAIRTL